MLNLIFLYFILYICTVILSLMIIFMSYKGFFGVKLQKLLAVNTMGKLFVSIIIIVGILMFFINLIVVFINFILNIDYYSIDYFCILDKNQNNNAHHSPYGVRGDLVKFWPSLLHVGATGHTAQTWAIIGTAAALYRSTPGSFITKASVALSSLIITIPLNVYLYAVENPNGFNRLMYSWVQYKNTGVWPATTYVEIPNNVQESTLNTAMIKNIENAQSGIYSNHSCTNFLPLDPKDLLSNFSPENLFSHFSTYAVRRVVNLFRPVGVEGHLDDLIGQQLFIHFLLISIVIGLIVLFTIYFLIQTMYNNKEFLTKRFNNRFIRFYINYQIILTKISLFVLPAFIFLGLIELFVGLYFIITHPIPYELLPIDLHTYLNKPSQ